MCMDRVYGHAMTSTGTPAPNLTKVAAKIAACQLVDCPKCDAPAGTVCKVNGRVLAAIAHPARVTLAGF